MNVKWEDVKEDYARKDAEIESLKAMNSELVEALGVTINIINIEHQERLSTKLCSTREHALGTATIILAKAKELNQ